MKSLCPVSASIIQVNGKKVTLISYRKLARYRGERPSASGKEAKPHKQLW